MQYPAVHDDSGRRHRPARRLRNGIDAVPVVDDGRNLLDVVSETDLLRQDVLRPHPQSHCADPLLPEHDLTRRARQSAGALGRTLRLAPDARQVSAHDGVLYLASRVGERSLIPIIERLCHTLDGVTALHHTLSCTYDDINLALDRPRTR